MNGIGNKKAASASATDDTCFNLPCGHKYHKACILEWALSSATCPECRAPLDGSEKEVDDVDISAFSVPSTDPDVNGFIMGEYPYSDNGDDNGDVDPSLLSNIDQNSNTSETEDE